MHKIILCYGTRPELIKVAPVVKAFREKRLEKHLILVNTNQHVHTMNEALFDIVPDYQLNVFVENQSMVQLASKISAGLDQLMQELKNKQTVISAVVGQGDTLTTLCAAQTSFFNRIPFYHIEAGLRSSNLQSPFPEEYNRRTISSIAAFNFVPSQHEMFNLLNEGIPEEKIKLVGNTVNDILRQFLQQDTVSPTAKNTVLFSVHRKLNQAKNLSLLTKQLIDIANANTDLNFIWLAHPTHLVKEAAESIEIQDSAVEVRFMVDYAEMIQLYKKCRMVITDSGGIMEESAFLGIPRIIIRSDNERVGITQASDTWVSKPASLDLMPKFKDALQQKGTPNHVYGTGHASEQILATLVDHLQLVSEQRDDVTLNEQ